MSESLVRIIMVRMTNAGILDGEKKLQDTLSLGFEMPNPPVASSNTHMVYANEFHYVVDVDLSWVISRDAPAWHIPEPLLANRYRGGNSTWALLAGAEDEFLRLAHKHGVQLSRTDRMWIKFTNWQVAQQRRLFGVYERLVTQFG